MILFTAGYPYSGKTELVKELIKISSKTIHIDPVSIRPPEYDSLSDDDKAKARIASCEVAQDMLTSALKKEPDTTIIIFDTCAAKTKTMMPHFVNARANRHRIFYVFLGATLVQCRGRAGANWPSKEVIDGYVRDFTTSVHELKRASDRFFFVKNMDDQSHAGLKLAAQRIAKAITDGTPNRVSQSKPVLGPTGGAGQKGDQRTKARTRRTV